MMNPECRSPEASVPVLLISESVFGKIRALRQFTEKCENFAVVQCPGGLEEMAGCCREVEANTLIVEGTAILAASPLQLKRLAPSSSGARVLSRVEYGKPPTEKDLMMLGCFGCLSDEITLPELSKLLTAVSRGEMWFPRKLISQVLSELLAEHSSDPLSRREREILALLGQELSNKQIAERLFISQETLRWHLRNLYAKTRLRSREKLVKYANEVNDAPLAHSVDEQQHAPKKNVMKPSAEDEFTVA